MSKLSAEQLSFNAFAVLQKTFASWDHTPKQEMLFALLDIHKTLSNMAYGLADDKIYLSSIDPGIGKTTAVGIWLSIFLKEEVLSDIGAIVFFDRHNQIDSFRKEFEIPEDSYAVLVGNNDPLALSQRGIQKEGITKARVLFTTKAQLRLLSRGKCFEDIEAFLYKGVPRKVRVIDEEMIPVKPLLLKVDSIASLFEDVNSNPELYAQLKGLYNDLCSCDKEQPFIIPEFCVSYQNALREYFYKDTKKAQLADTLWYMAGHAVAIKSDTGKGFLLVDFYEEIPSDISPCLVIDASARLRYTYELQEHYRKNIKRLIPAKKNYSNLNFNIMRTGGGRSACNKNINKLAKEIAFIIKSKPGKEFLVVVHKSHDIIHGRDDQKKAILSFLTPEDEKRVKFIHYGQHTATNEYANIENLILFGTLFYPDIYYQMVARSLALWVDYPGDILNEEIYKVKQGEHAHHLLQAVCRGVVRKCLNGSTPVCNVWIIAEPRTGIEKQLPDIFPGCNIEIWSPLEHNFRGKRKILFDHVLKQYQEKKLPVTLKELLNIGNLSDAGQLKRVFNEDFKASLAKLGLGFVYHGSRLAAIDEIPA